MDLPVDDKRSRTELRAQEFPASEFPTSVFRDDVFVMLRWHRQPPLKLYRLLTDDIMEYIADRIGEPLREFGLDSFHDIVENVFLFDLPDGIALMDSLKPETRRKPSKKKP